VYNSAGIQSTICFVPVLTFVVGAVSVDVVGGRDDQTDASSSCSSDPKNTSSHRYYKLKLRRQYQGIRIRIQHFRLNTDPDPDPIRIQGFYDKKLGKKF
jgi:hypothetical protein